MNIATPPSTNDTKAVVILYGWMEADPKHVKKYVNLYTQEKGCAVVYGRANLTTIMSRDKRKLAAIVIESVHKAAEILRGLESSSNETTVPVILHYFSNGGAFIVERFGQMMKEIKNGSCALDQSTIRDLKLVSERLHKKGFEILDSTPAYPHTATGYRVIETASPNKILGIIFKTLFSILLLFEAIMITLGKWEKVQKVFWGNMIENELCSRQVYIYSTIDELTDYVKLDELIELRKKRGVEVIVRKFDDSGHVLHMRKHPKIYNEVLDQVIKRVTEM